MTARRHPVTLPGDTEDTDTREKIGYGYDPGKTLKLHLPEGYDMGATSTTDLEPLSDHGAPPQFRRGQNMKAFRVIYDMYMICFIERYAALRAYSMRLLCNGYVVNR